MPQVMSKANPKYSGNDVRHTPIGVDYGSCLKEGYGETFNKWSWLHLAIGFGLGIAGAPDYLVVIGVVAWELGEDSLKDAIPEAFPISTEHDGKMNAVAEIGCVVAGYYAGKLLRS